VAGQTLTMLQKATIILLLLLLSSTLRVASADINITQLNDRCAQLYECQKREIGYWFDCHYDENIGDCRCYTGEFSKCNVSQSTLYSLDVTEVNLSIGAELPRPLEDLPFFAVAKNYGGKAFDWAQQTSFKTKLFALLLFGATITIIYYRNHASVDKDLKKAQKHHRLAEKAHKKGQEEKAAKHYELAEYHREKVHEQ